jgi:D-alanine-D-alanine ligase-like ATP-grasp enzyme
MSKFDLDYCAADFMEDKKGNIYFLELNTCGAWWWLDTFYNGAICKKIVNTLINRAGSF